MAVVLYRIPVPVKCMKTLLRFGSFSFAMMGSMLLCSEAMAFSLNSSLQPGDQFRLVFVSSDTRDATSTNIGDYNNFVDGIAAASPGLNAFLSNNVVLPTSGNPADFAWTAIASTSTTSAINNTGTSGTGGFPIFRLDGEKVADDYVDLWDGSLDNAIELTENNSFLSSYVWTGTQPNGNRETTQPLGHFLISQLGRSDSAQQLAGDDWIDRSFTRSYIEYPLYALSQPLTLASQSPQPVPTPALLPGLLGMGLATLRKRKLASSSQA